MNSEKTVFTDTSEQDSMCIRLHKLFNSKKRFNWNNIREIGFNNGIYIVFETDEKYYDMDRIVRVGTHTSDGRLQERLKYHFRGGTGTSVFCKNIKKAILNKNKFQKEVERIVVKEYMHEHFSFTCFQVVSKDERLRLEEGIIAALNKTSDFIPSLDWFGKYSPETEIVQSGMWLKAGLNGNPLTENEYINIEKYCRLVSKL